MSSSQFSAHRSQPQVSTRRVRQIPPARPYVETSLFGRPVDDQDLLTLRRQDTSITSIIGRFQRVAAYHEEEFSQLQGEILEGRMVVYER